MLRTIQSTADSRQSSVFACLGLTLFVCFAGCQRSTPAATQAAVSPAKLTHAVAESSLNTIELTEEAVKRLGLMTAVVESRLMERARPYGADLLLPTGATVIVSAPMSGTLKPSEEPGLFRVGQRIDEGHSLLKLLPLLSPERSVLTPAERIRMAEAKNTDRKSVV